MSLTFSVQQSDAMTCTGTSILPADADWVKKLGGSRCTKVKSWGWKPFEPRLMHLSWAESLLCLFCFCSFSLLLCFHCQVSPLESCSYKLFISIADLGGICGVTKYLVLTITCILPILIECNDCSESYWSLWMKTICQTNTWNVTESTSISL